MAQRLLRIIVPGDDRNRLREIVEEEGEEIAWEFAGESAGGDGLIIAEVVVPAEGNEPLLDALENTFRGRDRFRLVLIPLAATVPRPEEEEVGGGEEEEEEEGERDDGEGAGPPGSLTAPASPAGEEEDAAEADEEDGPSRISREELYTHVTDISGLGTYHIVMVALSAVVASVGLVRDSSAVVVGAMVIAPLLGPNMALALATTLGDIDLAKDALRTGLLGAAVALALSVGWGFLAEVDPTGRELTRVTQVGYSEVALALAAGAAGVLSVSRGTATALVGVMVAVALLPPLVAAGLLLGSGFRAGAVGAFTVLVANVICINLAGVVTFLVQGVRPRTWWEEDRAKKATRMALIFWAILLLGLFFVIQQLGTG